MKIQFRFSKLLESNKVIFILSLIIAAIAWLLVGIYVDDRTTRVISDIPVTIDLTDSMPQRYGLDVIEGDEQTISVRVEGVRAEIGNLTRDDFTVTPQLYGIIESGRQNVPIRVEITKSGDFSIIEAPETIEVLFDVEETREFEIVAVADKVKAADGFRKDLVTASPRTVRLTGPKAELDQIDQVRLEYDGDETVDTTFHVDNLELQMLDSLGNVLNKNEIPHVTDNSQSYVLTIPIYMQKELGVNVQFTNNVGKLDTSKLNYTLSDTSILVAGPKDIVSGRDEITIGPVDFTKLDIGSTHSFSVSLEAGMINENDVQQIDVIFDGDGYDSKLLNIEGGEDGNILLQNLPAGMDVEILTSQIRNVQMVGVEGDIELLSAEDLFAQVDVSNIEEGTSRIRVKIQVTGMSDVYANSNKYVWAVGEYYVQVRATPQTSEES